MMSGQYWWWLLFMGSWVARHQTNAQPIADALSLSGTCISALGIILCTLTWRYGVNAGATNLRDAKVPPALELRLETTATLIAVEKRRLKHHLRWSIVPSTLMMISAFGPFFAVLGRAIPAATWGDIGMAHVALGIMGIGIASAMMVWDELRPATGDELASARAVEGAAEAVGLKPPVSSNSGQGRLMGGRNLGLQVDATKAAVRELLNRSYFPALFERR